MAISSKEAVVLPACPTGTERKPYGPNRTKHDVAVNACVKSNVIAPKNEIRAKLHAAMGALGYIKGTHYIAYVRVMPLPAPNQPDGCSCMCGCS